jgi:hypothetical protein
MTKTPEQEFYGDVDHSRYRANWGCLAWFFGVGIILLLVGWYLVRYFGLR